MRILGIDTATPFGVVGLMEDGIPKGEIRFSIRPGGGERLPQALQDLLTEVAWEPSQLDLITVGLGPGSYTGIRLGVAFARAMAFGLGIPMVGVSTQAVLAEAGAFFPGIVCVLFDARRENLYASAFNFQQGRECLCGPEILTVDQFITQANGWGKPLLLFGDGARTYGQQLLDGLQVPFQTGRQEDDVPGGWPLARLGNERWQSVGKDETESCEPYYLRKVEAEVRLAERGKQQRG